MMPQKISPDPYPTSKRTAYLRAAICHNSKLVTNVRVAKAVIMADRMARIRTKARAKDNLKVIVKVRVSHEAMADITTVVVEGVRKAAQDSDRTATKVREEVVAKAHHRLHSLHAASERMIGPSR